VSFAQLPKEIFLHDMKLEDFCFLLEKSPFLLCKAQATRKQFKN
jgi:hypothetical protein